jgi:uncharacterized cupredoxin-like copper-binding protein
MNRTASIWRSRFTAPIWAGRLFWLVLGLILWFSLVTVPCANADSRPERVDLAHQTLQDIRIELGNQTNELRFVPNQLEFEAGKRYKLQLHNPSKLKHYFTAKDFADNIWSQKVDAGNVEVKGAIHELELRPGAKAEWVFVPVKSGTFELHCSIPGHTEAGMVGSILISTPQSDEPEASS